jgi:hypothetical protein
MVSYTGHSVGFYPVLAPTRHLTVVAACCVQNLFPGLMQYVKIRVVEMLDHVLATYNPRAGEYTEKLWKREGEGSARAVPCCVGCPPGMFWHWKVAQALKITMHWDHLELCYCVSLC